MPPRAGAPGGTQVTQEPVLEVVAPVEGDDGSVADHFARRHLGSSAQPTVDEGGARHGQVPHPPRSPHPATGSGCGDEVTAATLAAGHGSLRRTFGLGAALAGLGWFASLGCGARLPGRFLSRPSSWRLLDALVAVTMITTGGLLIAGA